MRYYDRLGEGGKAKVIGVSVKDRGAVSLAGHSGTAYWFSKASGSFVTSTCYLDAYKVSGRYMSRPARLVRTHSR